MAESGFPDWVLGSWGSVHAPAGTPSAIVNKLFSAIVKVMNDPVVIERVRAGGAEVVTSKSPEECAAFVRAQNELWARTIQEIGVTSE
jgi:tripartite-type tricarboxylate transporter receptor subunit TctC